MSDDVTRQGAEDQDVFDGMDLEPVTAESPEKGGQAEAVPEPKVEKPKEEGKDEGAAKVLNAEAKDRRITEKKTKITQQEWQATMDLVASQSAEIAQIRTEKEKAKFESKNPIVITEKYEPKWEELCKSKADPEHKYHKLDFSDLKKLMIDDETTAENEDAIEEYEETKIKQISPPAFKPSSAKSKTPGGIDPDSYSWLKSQGFSDEQIADSDNISISR